MSPPPMLESDRFPSRTIAPNSQMPSTPRMKLKPDWANLEALPLSLVLDKLEERIDHVWFGAVCKNWQSIAKVNHQNHQFKTNTLPMVVVPKEEPFWSPFRFSVKEKTWSLYGLPYMRHYPFYQLNQLFFANPNLRLCGSSHGWLALVDDSTSIITLMKPFIKDIPHIILPPLNLVFKVTLSADPIKSPNDYMVVAIYGSANIYGNGNLALMRRGQTSWTYLDTSKPRFCDVIFYKGILFALNVFQKIVSFNVGCLSDNLDIKTITSNVDDNRLQGYLVKSVKEELWMVREDMQWGVYHAYKLQLDVKKEKVEQMFELKCLEDNILFLGTGDSISVSASYFSKSLQRDSIYFASSLRIYDVKNENYTDYSPKDSNCDCNIWIQPDFQWNGVSVRRLPHGLQGEQSTQSNLVLQDSQSQGLRWGTRKRLTWLPHGLQGEQSTQSNLVLQDSQSQGLRWGTRKRLRCLPHGLQGEQNTQSNLVLQDLQSQGLRWGTQKRFRCIKLRDFHI